MEELLILGAGVAGLTAGIYALKNGYHVTICEQHSISGGNLTGWYRKGHHIDNCIHWLTGTNPSSELYKMWEDVGALGGNVDIYRAESLFTHKVGDLSVTLYRDLNKTVQEMLDAAPEDRKEILRFARAVRCMMGIQKLAGENHDSRGNLLKLAAGTPGILRMHMMTCREYGERFKSPVLKNFFASLTGPEFALTAFIMVTANFCGGNADLPVNGSYSMAKRMTDKFLELGGILNTKKKVVKINVENQRATSVEMADGSVYHPGNLIITLDPRMVFGRLMNVEMPKALKKLYDSEAYKRFSSFHTAFRVSGPVPFKGSLMLDVPAGAMPSYVTGDTKVVVREFSHEPIYYPQGSNIIQTMTFIDEKTAKNFLRMAKSPAEYKAAKQELARILKQVIEDQVPELKGRMECLDVWTPASYVRYVGSEIGSFMSFQLPKKKVPKVIPSKVKGLQNVFMATQWQIAPGGLPLAATAGKMAVDSLVKAGR